MKRIATVTIDPHQVIVNGVRIEAEGEGAQLLTSLYRQKVNDYPKFFKMDMLCRLGFIASELLLQAEGGERFAAREDRAVVIVNRSGSLCDDLHYQSTIQHADDFFPSPAVFVYTLSNIVTGEIAIRNHYYGETSCYILDEKDDVVIERLMAMSLSDAGMQSVIGGWVECRSESDFYAELHLMEK